MFFRYHYQHFAIGSYKVRIRKPKNLDRAAYGGLKPADISAAALPLFGIVWPSSEVLAQLVLDDAPAGRRVLEIGCGMGLVSLLLKQLDADVTAMDIHPLCGELLRDNSKLNGLKPIPFVSHSWSETNFGTALESLDPGAFELIVASDVLYEPQHVSSLATFLDTYLAASGEIIIVEPNRGQATDFVTGMRDKGFSLQVHNPGYSRLDGGAYEGVVYRFKR